MTLEYINNELSVNGHGINSIVKEYGTPLFVYDENMIRSQCRRYHRVLKEEELDYSISYASKAFTSVQMVKLLREENMKLDVVSQGELYTALKAGFDAADIHFHGNNKTTEEVEYALASGIGLIVVDALDEVELIDSIATENIDVLLRINPGVDVDTHEFIQTGQEDSKFGLSIHNGSALEAVNAIRESRHLNFRGIHYHLGSQLSAESPFINALEAVYKWLSEYSIDIEVLNMGGGYGVKYIESDTRFPIEEAFKNITERLRNLSETHNMPLPHVMIEPGRSIAAEAGTTIYEVGVIKEIPGLSKYVSINGGMSDHLRTPLYGAEYAVVPVNKTGAENIETHVVGKLCESGDIIGRQLNVPYNLKRGDLLAVKTTGAYHYSMASNYNQMTKPAVVFVNDESVRTVIKRQSLDQLIENDVF
ncbi:diaminopimelate decarboxylase [Salinicoccus halodurans]|uniref:Diaminopimelate decarboxylase n=1 Tax=Salinicoccus halodurans TaxID=407035 RepID=A0A0F7D4F3_9STAP|nr:diaminopimelate decarboxylase [Salinicoccus halodurans]AKG74135.1 diaminopimelate decarboxylase [Salinicoccus halodurans]SFK60972.1 diaminopimelate decarboxylase [Salinicoccus halodurans]